MITAQRKKVGGMITRKDVDSGDIFFGVLQKSETPQV